MPGIVGLITSKPRLLAERELNTMVNTLRHESFYTTGTWSNEGLGVYVGWVARRGSFSDGMPQFDETGAVALTFSGEEYSAGTPGTKSCPCYLVQKYKAESDFPRSLNGRFQGLLVDIPKREALLFNDRYGMHRVYYHQATDGFYFAAEAKALLAVLPQLRELNYQGLGELVSCKCTFENRTLLKDIHQLPAGAGWKFRNKELVSTASYFDPVEWESQSTLGIEPYYRDFRDTFAAALPRYFIGNEKIGMSLTGGFDSRMILAWHKPAPRSLPFYTFGDGTTGRQPQDVVVARQVAALCGQDHETIPVGQEFLSQFEHYAERTVYLSDGYVDLTYSPDIFLNERARQIAPVRMTGNYGSEVLRSSVAFGPWMPSCDLFQPEFRAEIELGFETYNRLRLCHPITFAAFRQAPWYQHGLLSLEQTQLAVRTPYLDNDVVRTAYRAPVEALSSNALCIRMVADGSTALHQMRTDRGFKGGHEGFGEAAYRNFLEFLFKAEYHYDSGMPQWIARIDHFFSPLHLEKLFLGWHKFHHFRIWYRDILGDYLREMLLDSKSLSRPYIRRQGVEAIVDGHLKRGLNYTFEIHTLLTLEIFHRLFMDAN